MKKLIIKLLPLFIWSSRQRKTLRTKLLQPPPAPPLPYDIEGENNQIILIENGEETPLSPDAVVPNLHIRIQGNNNRIELELPLSNLLGSSIDLGGNNNLIHICPSSCKLHFELHLNWQCHNRHIHLGPSLSCVNMKMYVNEDNAHFSCGEDCMMSSGVVIRTDGHAILNMEGEVLNDKADIRLGDHVWVGQNVFIFKNAAIASNSIVGSCSVVTKRFEQPHVVIAGNPARVIKEGICWERENASIYKRQQAEQAGNCPRPH